MKLGNVSVELKATGLDDLKNDVIKICDRLAAYEMREHREMWE